LILNKFLLFLTLRNSFRLKQLTLKEATDTELVNIILITNYFSFSIVANTYIYIVIILFIQRAPTCIF